MHMWLRLWTAQAYQHELKACTGTAAGTNTAKCKGMQTSDACTGASAERNTAGTKER